MEKTMRNIPTELVILEIAQSLKSLISNPDLSKTIKNAYALADDEKAKAIEARGIIAQSAQFLADLEKQKSAFSDANERIEKANSAEKANADILKIIADKKTEVDNIAKKNNADAKANKAEIQRLEALSIALDDRAAALKISEDQVADMRINLKNRAKDIKAQTADL